MAWSDGKPLAMTQEPKTIGGDKAQGYDGHSHFFRRYNHVDESSSLKRLPRLQAELLNDVDHRRHIVSNWHANNFISSVGDLLGLKIVGSGGDCRGNERSEEQNMLHTGE